MRATIAITLIITVKDICQHRMYRGVFSDSCRATSLALTSIKTIDEVPLFLTIRVFYSPVDDY